MGTKKTRAIPTLTLVLAACVGSDPFLVDEQNSSTPRPSDHILENEAHALPNIAPPPTLLLSPEIRADCELLKKKAPQANCAQAISSLQDDFEESTKYEMTHRDINDLLNIPLLALSRALVQEEINSSQDSNIKARIITNMQTGILQENMRILLILADNVEGLEFEDIPLSDTLDKKTAEAIIKLSYAYDYTEAFINNETYYEYKEATSHIALAEHLKTLAPDTYKEYNAKFQEKRKQWLKPPETENQRRYGTAENCGNPLSANIQDRFPCEIEINYQGHTFKNGTYSI